MGAVFISTQFGLTGFVRGLKFKTDLFFEGGGDMETVKDQDGFIYEISRENERLVCRKVILSSEREAELTEARKKRILAEKEKRQ